MIAKSKNAIYAYRYKTTRIKKGQIGKKVVSLHFQFLTKKTLTMYRNMKRMALLLVAAATLFNVSCKKENKDNPGTDGSFIPAKVE